MTLIRLSLMLDVVAFVTFMLADSTAVIIIAVVLLGLAGMVAVLALNRLPKE